MSKISIKQFTCPSCGYKGEFRMYESVNVSLDPKLREEVLSGRIFDWKCPECGETTSIRYNLLYHDMDNKFQIYYSPTNCIDLNKMINDMKAKYPGMQELCRTVDSLNSLKEKIYIFESGLNDIVIELLKIVIKDKERNKIPEGSEVRFAGLISVEKDTSHGKLLFKPILDDQPQQGLVLFDKVEYDKLLSEVLSNDRYKMTSYCDTINEDWVLKRT